MGLSGNHEGLNLASRYQITTLEMQGALCGVYRGQDTTLRRPIAVKAVPPEHAETYRSALRTIATLTHPAIISTYDAVEHDGWLFIVQEFVAARPMGVYIRNGVPTERALDIGLQLARAIAYAHAHGIIHGDITPASVLIDRQAVVRVNNFGAPPDTVFVDRYASVLETTEAIEDAENTENTEESQTLSTQDALTGLPASQQPGQDVGAQVVVADPHAEDVRSVGLLIWLLLTERQQLAPATETHDSWARIFRQDIPDDVRALLQRCVRRDHPERILDAETLCSSLETLQADLATRRTPLTEHTPPALRAARAATAREEAWSAKETMATAGQWTPTSTDPDINPSGVTEPATLGVPPSPMSRPGTPQFNLPTRGTGSPSTTLEYEMRASPPDPASAYIGPFVAPERATGRSGMPVALLVLLIAAAAFIIFFLIGFFGPSVLGGHG